MVAGSPSPGWFDDPIGVAQKRWWDGERWTDSTRGQVATSPAPPPPPSPPKHLPQIPAAPPTLSASSAKWPIWVSLLVVVAGVSAGAVMGRRSRDNSDSAAASAPSVTTAASTTVPGSVVTAEPPPTTGSPATFEAPVAVAPTVISTIPVGAFPWQPQVIGEVVAIPNNDDDTVSLIDADSLETIATVPVGFQPSIPTVVDGMLWVTSPFDGTISVVDTNSGTVVSTIGVAPPGGDWSPVAVLDRGGSTWVIDAFGILTVIDSDTFTVSSTVDLNAGASDPLVVVSVGPVGDEVWLSGIRVSGDGSDQPVTEAIDGISAQPTAVIPDVGSFIVASSDGVLWVTGPGSSAADGSSSDETPGMIWEIDATGHKVIAATPVSTIAYSATLAFGRIWMPDLNGTLTAVDASSMEVVAEIPVGPAASSLEASGMIWVPLPDDGSMAVVDPETMTVIDSITIEGRPGFVVEAAGRVWVINAGNNTVSVIDPGER